MARCKQAEPRHGEYWTRISKAVENAHDPVDVLLKKARARGARTGAAPRRLRPTAQGRSRVPTAPPPSSPHTRTHTLLPGVHTLLTRDAQARADRGLHMAAGPAPLQVAVSLEKDPPP